MLNTRFPYEFFESHKDEKQGLMLAGLTSNKESKIIFFNPEYGSTATKRNLEFSIDDRKDVTVSQIVDENLSGSFSVVGQLDWISPVKEVMVKGKYPNNQRSCMFHDGIGSIVMKVWGDKLINTLSTRTTLRLHKVVVNEWEGRREIGTTYSTSFQELTDRVCDVEWENVDLRWINTVVCSSNILSARLGKYLVCHCGKWMGADPTPNETMKCRKCDRKLRSAKCKSTFLVKLTLDTQKRELSVFPRVFENNDVKEEDAVDWILSLKDKAIEYDEKKFTVIDIRDKED